MRLAAPGGQRTGTARAGPTRRDVRTHPIAPAVTALLSAERRAALSLYQDERLGDAQQHVDRSIAASANYLERATINEEQGRKL
jgi:hypothetical protein